MTRRALAAASLIFALAAPPAFAQTAGPDLPGSAEPATSPMGVTPTPSPAPGRHITATGRTMPPVRTDAAAKAAANNNDEALKAQRAIEARDKAWDAKMKRTLGSICVGC